MKYRGLILFLVCMVLVPQMVFAAWWNPLSWFNNWGFLRGSDTKTEMLENRVKELEEKLKIASTTPNIKDAEIIPPAKIEEDKVVNTIKKESPKQNTYSGSVLIAPYYTSASKILDSEIGLVDLLLDDSTRYIDGIPPLISKAKNGSILFPDQRDFWDLIANTYTSHLNNITNVRQLAQNYRKTVLDYKDEINRKSISVMSSTVTAEDLSVVKKQTDSDLQKIESSVDSITKTYKDYTNAFLNDKDEITSLLELGMYSLQSAINQLESSKSVIPTFRIPTKTSCFYYNYTGGGNIDCYSY